MTASHQIFASADTDQVRETLNSLYGRNRFAFVGDDRRARVTLEQSTLASVGIVCATFSTGFRIDMEGAAEAPGSLGIFMREMGSVNVQTDTGNVHCTQGQWIPFSAGVTRSVSAGPGLRDIAILLDGEAVASALRHWIGASPDEPLHFDPVPFSSDLATRWGELTAALRALASIRDCPPLAVRGLLDHGIGLILDNHPHNFSHFRRPYVDAPLDPTRIARLRNYIASSLDKDIKVSTLARLAGMKTSSFLTAFRDAFGTTPGRFVREERLRRACWLLEHSDTSIAHIAAETGFASQSHLTSRLLAATGTTPRQYRKRSRVRPEASSST